MPTTPRSFAPTRLRVPLAAAAALSIASCLLVPSTASAADLVGTESPWWTGTWSTSAIAPGAAVFNVTDPRPGSQLAAPADGVVTQWRTEVFGDPIAQLLIVRPAGNGRWRIVRAGPVQDQRDATSTASGSGTRFEWPARLPIAAGDQLALRQADPVYGYWYGGQDAAGGTTAIFADKGVGSPAATPDPWMASDRLIGLNADVEPDADGDGWGDETQDLCPGVDSQDQTDTDGDGRGDVCDLDDDGDGLSDADEPTHGTDPLVADTDGDGLLDGDEVARGTDPTRADSDGDGLVDAVEIALGTDPTVADSDGDGVVDGADRCPLANGRGAADGCPVVTVEVPGPSVTVPGPPVAVTPVLPTVAFAEPSSPLKLHRPAPVPVALTVTGVRPGATVELLRGSDVLCSWTEAPYTCTWQPDGAAVGRTSLVAVARTDAFGAVAAHRTVRMGRFRPAGVKADAALRRIAGGRLRMRATGSLVLPERVSAAQGCTGWATVRVLRGRTLVSVRQARVGGDCGFARAWTFPVQERTRGRLRVVVRFGGNSVVTPARARAAVERSAGAARGAAVRAGARPLAR